jgi:hypothetical protein
MRYGLKEIEQRHTHTRVDEGSLLPDCEASGDGKHEPHGLDDERVEAHDGGDLDAVEVTLDL